MSLLYCKKWWLIRNLPIDIISSEDAKKLHNNHQPYTVVIKRNSLTNVVNIHKNGVVTNFINESGNLYLLYDFQKVEQNSERMFLKGVIYYNYDSNNNKVESILYNFHTNGYVIMEKYNFLSGETIQKDLTTNITTNWENFPEFGNYDNLIIPERF